MQAQEMMTRSVITIPSDASLALAMRLMHDHRIRHLPILSGTQLVGIVTDRDLRRASPSPATSLTPDEIAYQMGTTPVVGCMTHDVVTLRPEEDIVQGARRLLEGQFGCLPVVAEGRLIGILTDIDLLRGFLVAVPAAGGPMKVREYMHRSPYTATPDEALSLAYQRMQDARIRHLPIVTSELQLIGMLTDRDIREAGASTELHMAAHELPDLLEQMTVREIMTTRVTTVQGDTPIIDAGQILLEHKVGCLPVVHDDNVLEGIITVTDLLRAYVGQQEARRTQAGMQGQAKAWYETFFDAHYLQGFTAFTTPEITERQVDFMVKILNLPPHSRILDLGCGTGRHSLVLGARGFQVVGYDLSEALLSVARPEAEQRWFPIEFVQGDMRILPYRAEFDAVISYFTSFGYFTEMENRRVLEQVMQALKGEGKFLVDVVNRDTALQHQGARRWWRGEQQTVLLEEVQYDAWQSRFTSVWTLLQADGTPYVFPRMEVRAYALHELAALCTEVGLKVLEVYGNEHGDHFHPLTSPRIILLAQKQEAPELFDAGGGRAHSVRDPH